MIIQGCNYGFIRQGLKLGDINTEQNIKNKYRQLGFNIKNINLNYKQKSTKGNINVTGNRGETYFTGSSKFPMQRALQLNINNVKLNKNNRKQSNNIENIKKTITTDGLSVFRYAKDNLIQFISAVQQIKDVSDIVLSTGNAYILERKK